MYRLLLILLVLILGCLAGLNIPFGEKYLSTDLSSIDNIDDIRVVMNQRQNGRANILIRLVESQTDASKGEFCVNEIRGIGGELYPVTLAHFGQSARVKDVPLEAFLVTLVKAPCGNSEPKLKQVMKTIRVEPRWSSLTLYDRIRYST